MFCFKWIYLFSHVLLQCVFTALCIYNAGIITISQTSARSLVSSILFNDVTSGRAQSLARPSGKYALGKNHFSRSYFNTTSICVYLYRLKQLFPSDISTWKPFWHVIDICRIVEDCQKKQMSAWKFNCWNEKVRARLKFLVPFVFKI